MNPIIEQLHAKLNALRAEWEGLPERRRARLLAGSRDALLDAEVRKIQIPYEAVKACNLAVHALLAELEAEARELEAERDRWQRSCAGFEARSARAVGAHSPCAGAVLAHSQRRAQSHALHD
jgi:hypothetical protein